MSPGDRFRNRNVLVTGASRGLGRALATAFAREGARVGIGFRARTADAEETLAAVEGAGGTGVLLQMDLREPATIRDAVGRFDQGTPVDVLVNNAAIVNDHPFAMLDEAGWTSVVDTNLSGCYRCSRAVLPAMMAAGSGVILNVVSVAAIRASPGQANYAASKGGVLALTATLASEVARYGVRVNALLPGLLSTGMGARLDHRVRDERTRTIPVGRLGEAREVADAALFLASDEASYIVGQTLVVDGGLSL